ncbi:MAG: hypothetical protein R3246_10205 [Acidimicrobiia bacterium]|nr:hypothetical protein [Acidimicrobiia bacterium]
MIIEVGRSPLKAWIAAVLAVPLLLLAIDIAITNRVYPHPQQDANGNLTGQGQSERRTDIVLGLGLATAGVALGAWSLYELREQTRPGSVLRADERGLELGTASRYEPPAWVPWQYVTSVRTTVDRDATGEHQVLAVEFRDDVTLRADIPSSRVSGTRLLLDPDNWDTPVVEVSDRLHILLERSRREEELEEPFPLDILDDPPPT